MTSDPNQIRQDIEATRNELGSDVDALTNKVNPKRVAGERVNRARGRLQGIREKVMGTAAHANEVGGAKASSAGHAARDAAGSAAHQVSSAGEAARGAAGSAAHQVSSAGHAVRDAAGSARQRQHDLAQGSPLAAGLVAFGLGVLVSALLPPSPQERQAAGRLKGKASEHSQGLKQGVAGAAHQVQDNLREPAQQAMGSVRSRATEGASALQEQGRSAAHDVQGQAQAARENVQGR